MRILKIKVVDLIYERLVKEGKEYKRSPEEQGRIIIQDNINSLLMEDEKDPCRGRWHGGHSPKEPNDGKRTICSTCGKGLVKYGLGYHEKWVLDKTKKALDKQKEIKE